MTARRVPTVVAITGLAVLAWWFLRGDVFLPEPVVPAAGESSPVLASEAAPAAPEPILPASAVPGEVPESSDGDGLAVDVEEDPTLVVTGEVVLSPAIRDARVWTVMELLVGDAALASIEILPGLPDGPGPFRFECPPFEEGSVGAYRLNVSAVVAGRVFSVQRRLPSREGRIDLGELRLGEGSALRIRVVDREGLPVEQALVRLFDEQEGVATPFRAAHADGFHPRAGLVPGRVYRLDVRGVDPKIERTVVAPVEGERRDEVVRIDALPVVCDLDLRLDGRPINAEAGIVYLYAGDQGDAVQWKGGKALRVRRSLLPGAYRLAVTNAVPAEDPEGRRLVLGTEFRVPTRDRWEATLDLVVPKKRPW